MIHCKGLQISGRRFDFAPMLPLPTDSDRGRRHRRDGLGEDGRLYAPPSVPPRPAIHHSEVHSTEASTGGGGKNSMQSYASSGSSIHSDSPRAFSATLSCSYAFRPVFGRRFTIQDAPMYTFPHCPQAGPTSRSSRRSTRTRASTGPTPSCSPRPRQWPRSENHP